MKVRRVVVTHVRLSAPELEALKVALKVAFQSPGETQDDIVARWSKMVWKLCRDEGDES